jgi:hypothetical protein
MPVAINLVCTHCTDGNHIALRRWYADHVHLLLAAPELVCATLHRCTQPLAGQPPDYFCIYEFTSLDDFLVFEHSEAKARATELTNAAAGRSSIEIVQRSQYARWLHRKWPGPPQEQGEVWRLAACFENEAGWSLDAQRWLADHLQALLSCTPLVGAQVFSGSDQAFAALDFSGGDPAAVWQLLQHHLAQPAPYGQTQRLKMRWATTANVLQQWQR